MSLCGNRKERLYALNLPFVLRHGWLENGPCISDFPMPRNLHLQGIFQPAMFDYQRVWRRWFDRINILDSVVRIGKLRGSLELGECVHRGHCRMRFVKLMWELQFPSPSSPIYIYIYISPCQCTHIYIYIIYIFVLCACIYIYIYTYIYIYIHAF